MDSSETLLIVFFKLFLAFIIPSIIRYYAKRKSKPFWANLLFFLQIGPRTDTKYMRKEELYKSGFKFLIWSAYLFIVLLIVSYRVGIETGTLHPLVSGIFFIIVILFMMCLVGGIYLLFRGLIRSKNFVPPERNGGLDIHL